VVNAAQADRPAATTTGAGCSAATSQHLRRALSNDAPDGEGPRGNCGREESEECGMRNPQECQIHALPTDDDPETMAFAGTLQQRREQLRAARRYGLRF
jgi:hypothetical protein